MGAVEGGLRSWHGVDRNSGSCKVGRGLDVAWTGAVAAVEGGLRS